VKTIALIYQISLTSSFFCELWLAGSVRGAPPKKLRMSVGIFARNEFYYCTIDRQYIAIRHAKDVDNGKKVLGVGRDVVRWVCVRH